MSDRQPVTTAEELRILDDDEMLEGYRDGRAGDSEPGGNRSKSYWHGWRNGFNDRMGQADAEQLMLIQAVKANGGGL